MGHRWLSQFGISLLVITSATSLWASSEKKNCVLPPTATTFQILEENNYFPRVGDSLHEKLRLLKNKKAQVESRARRFGGAESLCHRIDYKLLNTGVHYSQIAADIQMELKEKVSRDLTKQKKRSQQMLHCATNRSTGRQSTNNYHDCQEFWSKDVKHLNVRLKEMRVLMGLIDIRENKKSPWELATQPLSHNLLNRFWQGSSPIAQEDLEPLSESEISEVINHLNRLGGQVPESVIEAYRLTLSRNPILTYFKGLRAKPSELTIAAKDQLKAFDKIEKSRVGDKFYFYLPGLIKKYVSDCEQKSAKPKSSAKCDETREAIVAAIARHENTAELTIKVLGHGAEFLVGFYSFFKGFFADLLAGIGLTVALEFTGSPADILAEKVTRDRDQGFMHLCMTLSFIRDKGKNSQCQMDKIRSWDHEDDSLPKVAQ